VLKFLGDALAPSIPETEPNPCKLVLSLRSMALRHLAGAFALLLATARGLMVNRLLDNDPPKSRVSYWQELRNVADTQYYGNISVGGQVLEAVFDTGSLELIVISSRCEHCGDESRLYRANNASHKYGPRTVLHSYGSGQISSREAYDSVALGPFQDGQAPFWEVYDAAMPVLTSSDFEVIAGLSPLPSNLTLMRYHALHNEKAFASLQAMMGISAFSICLGQAPQSPGLISWNDPLPTQRPQDFMEVNLAETVDETKQWMAELRNVRVGDSQLACSDEHSCGAIIDSGTSLLAMPPSVAYRLRDMIGDLDSDCTDLDRLPSFHFKLGGQELTLPPESYIFKAEGQPSESFASHVQLSALSASRRSSCQVLVMTASLTTGGFGDTWILGMPFFRKYYTSFLQHPPRLLLAEANYECQPVSENPREASLESERRHIGKMTSRHIDVSKLRVPVWLRRSLTVDEAALPATGETLGTEEHSWGKKEKSDAASAISASLRDERSITECTSGVEEAPLEARVGVSIGERKFLG